MRIEITSDYDEFLKKVYGDYMQLTPAEKRVTHHSHYLLDLENSWSIEEILSNKN